MNLTQITAKGQITVPQEVRKSLGLDRGDLLFFLVQGDRAMLIPLRRRALQELMGALPVTRPGPGIERIRRVVRRDLGRRIAEGEE